MICIPWHFQRTIELPGQSPPLTTEPLLHVLLLFLLIRLGINLADILALAHTHDINAESLSRSEVNT